MNKRKLGSEKEALAAAYLEKQGLCILERNYRCRSGEIDLVCSDGTYLIFTEVKYRKNPVLGNPLAAVTSSKQRTICRVASVYLRYHGCGWGTPVRYDVIGICGEEITWIKNAFPHQG